MTNAVKHFKFTQRGKRRIHDKPDRYEIAACKPWLGAELEAIEPGDRRAARRDRGASAARQRRFA